MTIKMALEWLEHLKKIHGENVDVYFDCPVCKQSFSPSTVVAQAIHVTADLKKSDV